MAYGREKGFKLGGKRTGGGFALRSDFKEGNIGAPRKGVHKRAVKAARKKV